MSNDPTNNKAISDEVTNKNKTTYDSNDIVVSFGGFIVKTP